MEADGGNGGRGRDGLSAGNDIGIGDEVPVLFNRDVVCCGFVVAEGKEVEIQIDVAMGGKLPAEAGNQLHAEGCG